MKFTTVTFLLLLATTYSFSTERVLLKPYKKIHLPKNEPSEICLASDNTTFYVLANKALLYRMDENGKFLNQSAYNAFDIEGATVYNDTIYVVEESLRQVLVYDEATLTLVRKIQLQYNGPRNTAFESIVFNPETNHFILATEKNPQVFFEYDKNFVNVNEFSIPGIQEVSGMTWHNNQWWVLSDEQETVYQIDPKSHQILNAWSLPIINPEGLCFDASGNLIVVSDDMGKVFFFHNPLNKTQIQ